MRLRMNLLLTAALLITSTGVFDVRERTLEIQRYPNEPLQLVDLKVSGQSVKDRIVLKQKFADKSQWSLDSVTFSDDDDWYKHVSFRYRNVSDKTIYGVGAFLFFKPGGERNMFMVQLNASTDLKSKQIEPGGEVELTVDDLRLQPILQMMSQAGVDANKCEVSFSLDSAVYSEQLRWDRGHLLRPDPATPNKWIPVNGPRP
jgi:hypothetical protein